MSADHDTLLIRQACCLRWPRRHVAGLAQLLRRPKPTAASWLAGRRQMPVPEIQALAEVLRADGQLLIGIASNMLHAAEIKQARPRHARGFQVVKERDGPGSTPRDARWRGGRPKRNRQ